MKRGLSKFVTKYPIVTAIIISMIIVGILMVGIYDSYHESHNAVSKVTSVSNTTSELAHENKSLGEKLTTYLEESGPAGKKKFQLVCEETNKVKKIIINIEENDYKQDLQLLKEEKITVTPQVLKTAIEQYKYALKQLSGTKCEAITDIGPEPLKEVAKK